MVLTLEEAVRKRHLLKLIGETLVMTNGVFDILHRGHIEYLEKASQYGKQLWVAVNSDVSVKKIKGEKRPIIPWEDRVAVLSALRYVDHVLLFDEDTPLALYKTLLPDVLVKGADYTIEQIAGAKEILDNGGKVVTIELTPNQSTTKIIEKILSNF
ncbi:MAG: D-glycero-beta-D-manno-heptose 1-phosphate adenylyltransferase [bacterium]|nr:D-glycero-beta-D-manno-heptose 1-phosphate adenylyltransferase [bacterium]